jgi:hypothetical protein
VVSPRVLLASLVLASLVPESAHAAAYTLEARSEAQLYSFRSWRQGPNDRPTLIPRRRFVEYLGLNAYEIVPGQPVGFESALRVYVDFGLPQEEAARIDGLKVADADLLYANIIYSGDILTAKVGRQTYVDVMDFVSFDGALVRISAPLADGLLRLGGEAYIGLWVKGTSAIASSEYQPDGIRESDLRRVANFEAPPYGALDDIEPLFGFKFFVENFKNISVSAGFRQAWLGGKTDIQRLAFEGKYASGFGLNIFGALEYDMVMARISNARALARYDWSELSFSVEYGRTSPVLSADSIFLYFAHMPRDSGRVRIDVYPVGPFRFYGHALGDIYHLNINENSPLAAIALQDPALPAGFSFGAGGGIAFKLGPIHAAADVTFKTGYGGGQIWTDISGGWAPQTLPLTADLRFTWANLGDMYNPLLKGNFFGFQVMGGYAFARNARLSVALEENVNPFSKSDTKIFLLFDLKSNI